ncbi:MAG: aminotransferase class III-fold pyridoxal phosphate-dependent enzyme [Myxococcales bacterium]|nr:aminotransferase class III-fold pyridoxal phosphate-dependent enzyme [Myxococcales bacterium]
MSQTRHAALMADPRIAEARALIQSALAEHRSAVTAVCGPDPALAADYDASVEAIGQIRGRGLFFPYLGSGLGNGPYVELDDGSIKLDFISGIGVHGWGHGDAGITDAAIDAALQDTIMQGNLQQNTVSLEVGKLLVDGANRWQSDGRFSHCFLTTTGAMANENAYKILLQNKAPASRALAFAGNFSGRTLGMCWVTDKAANRVGVPQTIQTDYIPHFNPDRPEVSTRRALYKLERLLARYPGQHALMSFELVLGEGGYYAGTTEFYRALMQRCKDAGIAVHVDEVQTFGRTTEMYAFQHFGLDDLVDVVSVGKVTQVCATVFTNAVNPKPGLLSQTFTGATAAFHAAKVIIEGLRDGGFYGDSGRNVQLHNHFVAGIKGIGERHPGWVKGPFGVGAMVGFTPFGGDPAKNKALLAQMYKDGLLGFTAGKNPTRMRFLMPLGVVTEAQIDDAVRILEISMAAVA